MKNKLGITFDGTSGSGKGTIARRVADYYHCAYLDTGKLYRALALLILERNLEGDFISSLEFLTAKITSTLLMDKNLYDEKTSIFASKIAALPEVRKSLYQYQQDFVFENLIFVLDGRDTGSVICPKAQCKFYIDADPEVRAQRRFEQNILHYKECNMSILDIKKSLIERDNRDKNREVAPLIVPEGAHIIDNSYLPIKDIVQKIIDIIDSLR